MASRDVLEAPLAHVADAVYLADADGRIGFANPAALALLNYAEDEVLGRDAHATLHHHLWDGTPHPAEDCRALTARVTGETVRGYGEAFWRKDGSPFRIAYSSAPLDTTRGTGVVVVFRDVTAHMETEEAARQQAVERARAEEIHASRGRLVQAADEERRRLVRNLHDGSQQRLVRILLELRLAAKDLTGRADDIAARLDAIAQETTLAIGDLRDLGSGLSPQILTNRGLAAAVESLTAGLPIPIELRIVERRFVNTIEAAAYFVVAEALPNVIKHSHAASASVAVAVAVDSDHRLEVRVFDDGRGGATARAAGGLAGIADRLAALDGELRLQSPPGSGTLIVARLPIVAAGGVRSGDA